VSILVSNDDGVSATGLKVLSAELSLLDEVWVVAPDRDQSGVSHSVTLQRPLRIDEIGPRIFAVDGTPTDCVNLAINGILPERPRMVVSGINHGANLGDDVTYSGTVSAAMEATLLGVPALAISQVIRNPEKPDFAFAAKFARALAARVLERPMPPDTLLNVNVPPRRADEIQGYTLTRQGKRRYGDAVVEKVDPRGRKYYWIAGDVLDFVDADGTDFDAVQRGYVSITPLHLDLTNYESFRLLEKLDVPWQ
jgi:5'-nucleotidase